jgi:hypothetical protein
MENLTPTAKNGMLPIKNGKSALSCETGGQTSQVHHPFNH